MAESKSAALPLGYAPMRTGIADRVARTCGDIGAPDHSDTPPADQYLPHRRNGGARGKAENPLFSALSAPSAPLIMCLPY
jgi:hypothetical protein